MEEENNVVQEENKMMEVVGSVIPKCLSDVVTKTVVTKAIADTSEAAMGVGKRFVRNIVKRTNVGYGFFPAVAGGTKETIHYYGDKLAGRDPVEMQEAVFFDLNS